MCQKCHLKVSNGKVTDLGFKILDLNTTKQIINELILQMTNSFRNTLNMEISNLNPKSRMFYHMKCFKILRNLQNSKRPSRKSAYFWPDRKVLLSIKYSVFLNSKFKKISLTHSRKSVSPFETRLML